MQNINKKDIVLIWIWDIDIEHLCECKDIWFEMAAAPDKLEEWDRRKERLTDRKPENRNCGKESGADRKPENKTRGKKAAKKRHKNRVIRHKNGNSEERKNR